ncbi:MAG: dienelactone hydrolase family protein [Tagaea sp.]|nr:dienelactone hydrolase family protein [Tagaea sp.]
MIERDVALATPDGTMPVFVVHPDEGGPLPVVLVYMDALGIREELRDMTRRFASAGYYAMLANLYYRWGGSSFDGSGLADGKFDPRMMELNDALSMDMTVRDAGVQLDFAARDPAAAKTGAAVGYCMGGRHAIAAGEAFGDRVKCFASIHGGRLVTEASDSPHRRLARATGEAYFGWAFDDPTAPAAHEAVVRDVLAKRGLRHRVELHEGALHGFAFPERYCFHKRAAETVWARLFAMFGRNLAAH